VRVSFKDLRAIESSIPVPEFDGHIVRTGQDVGQRGMHFERSNVVRVRFKLLDLFHCVVVENAQSHVITGSQEPLLADDEASASHGKLADFKGFDHAARLVVPDHDIARVQRREDPWLRRVQIHALDALTRSTELFLDVQSEWLYGKHKHKQSV
jgi:hypothetical protein